MLWDDGQSHPPHRFRGAQEDVVPAGVRVGRLFVVSCRGDWIRTSDFLLPKQAL